MAPPAGTLRVGRYFLALLILFVVLFAIVFWPGQRHAPKLGLDLRGGAADHLQGADDERQGASRDSMNQAKQHHRPAGQRPRRRAVEVVIQGSDEIVVTVPGKRADQLTTSARRRC